MTRNFKKWLSVIPTIKKNELSPLTSNQRTQINTMRNGVGNSGSG